GIAGQRITVSGRGLSRRPAAGLCEFGKGTSDDGLAQFTDDLGHQLRDLTGCGSLSSKVAHQEEQNAIGQLAGQERVGSAAAFGRGEQTATDLVRIDRFQAPASLLHPGGETRCSGLAHASPAAVPWARTRRPPWRLRLPDSRARASIGWASSTKSCT